MTLLALLLRIGGLPAQQCAFVLLSPAVAENALTGQSGALIAAVLIGGLLLLDRRPVLAGVLFGVLVCKPQFALMLPVACLAGRRWTTAIWACCSGLVLCLSSWLIFGYHIWVGFLAETQLNIAGYLEAPWDAKPAQLISTSAFMAARSVGAGIGTAYLAQAAAAALGAVVVWSVWRHPAVDPTTRVAATAAATLLGALGPHLRYAGARRRHRHPAAVGHAAATPAPGHRVVLAGSRFAAVVAAAAVVAECGQHRLDRRQAGLRAIIFRLILLFCGLLAQAGLAVAAAPGEACDAAAAKAEQEWALPAGVLAAVGTVESGRSAGSGGAAPWPWTINAAGRGSFHGSKAEAVAAVLTIMESGYPFIDVGCFQIDIAYHSGVFRSLDDAFDPERNAQEAARILAAERLRAPDWATAVARYHSATPDRGSAYLRRVQDALPAAKRRTLEATVAALAPAASPADLTAPTPRLPVVVYGRPVSSRFPAPQLLHIVETGPLPRVIAAQTQPERIRP